METIKRNPVVLRNLVIAVLAVAAAFVPGLDVGTIEGIAMGAIALVLGVDARAKVTPVADPRL